MYNPTCLITGKTDNLKMHSLRDKNQNMIGWVFVHDSIKMEEINATLNWEQKYSVRREDEGDLQTKVEKPVFPPDRH